MDDERYDSELERQLREAAEGLHIEPSERVWAGISAQLHPRRRKFLWWGAAAATLALLLALGVYLQRRPARQPVAGQQAVQEHRHASAQGGAGKKAAPQAIPPATPDEATAHAAVVPGVAVPPPTAEVPDEQPAVNRALPVLSGLAAQTSTPTWIGDGPGILGPEPAGGQSPEASATAALPAASVPRHRKLSFSVFFSPSSGYRVMKETPLTPVSLAPAAPSSPSNPPSLTAAPPAEKAGTRQRPDFSWAIGIRTGLSLGSHTYFQTGISLQQTAYRVLTYGTYPGYTLSGPVRRPNMFLATRAIPAALQRGVYRKNRYLQAEIPVMAGWRFGDLHRTHLSVAAGAGISYLLHSDPLIYSPKSDRYLTDKGLIRPVNSLLHLETALHIPLGSRTAVSLGPSVSYQLLSSYRNFDEVKEHPYQIGITAGIHWRR